MINENKNCDQIYDYDHKKKIVYRIQNLKNKSNYIKLFNIIKKHKVNFTKNSNGIFFNINKLNIEVLKVIEKFLNDCENSKKIESDNNLIDYNTSSEENSINLFNEEKLINIK